ncbi:MAG: hypothetical protein ACFB2X_26830 [Rivularia sp. (in: cyanobacteria)]
MNKITTKISGLLMIIYALIPMILITAFTITLLTIVNDVRIFVSGPINEINTTLIQVRQTAEQAGEQLGKSLEPIQQVNRDIQKALKQVDNLYIPDKISVPNLGIPNLKLPVKPNVKISGKLPPKVNIKMDKVSVNMPSIRGFDIPVPGLKDVKSILENNFVILGQFNEVVGNIPNLEAIREDSQKIVVEVQKLFKDLQSIGYKILILIILGAMILIPIIMKLIITPFIRWFYITIRRGWELISN